MAIAIVLVLLVIGTVVFHFLSPWWFTPIASNWETMDDTVNLTFWVTGVVFVAVNLFMAYAIVRYRHRKGQAAGGIRAREQEARVVADRPDVGRRRRDAGAGPVRLGEVRDRAGRRGRGRGRRPAVALELPLSGRGRRARRHRCLARSAPTIPFGIDADDPRRPDDVLVAESELHLPLDQPVKLLLRSKDVLHNFTVPQFRVKMDMVPGHGHLPVADADPDRRVRRSSARSCAASGTSRCAAGSSSTTPTTYRTWLASQPTFAQSQARPAADAAAGQATYAVCTACHGAQGEGNQALNAPKLAGQPSWYLARQLHNFQARRARRRAGR